MVQNKSNLSLANRRQSSFFRQLPPAEPDVYYIGVDVGTGSARACLIDTNGIILGLAERPIKRQELEANYITQNSTEIWEAICYCVRSCLRDSGVQPEDVFGIGFDATCSLVAISELTDQPVSVGPNFKNDKDNIILWMDHRAVDETNAINATNDKCLKYVGGQMSIEMELPKMKWLKHHKPGGIKIVNSMICLIIWFTRQLVPRPEVTVLWFVNKGLYQLVLKIVKLVGRKNSYYQLICLSWLKTTLED